MRILAIVARVGAFSTRISGHGDRRFLQLGDKDLYLRRTIYQPRYRILGGFYLTSKISLESNATNVLELTMLLTESILSVYCQWR